MYFGFCVIIRVLCNVPMFFVVRFNVIFFGVFALVGCFLPQSVVSTFSFLMQAFSSHNQLHKRFQFGHFPPTSRHTLHSPPTSGRTRSWGCLDQEGVL